MHRRLGLFLVAVALTVVLASAFWQHLNEPDQLAPQKENGRPIQQMEKPRSNVKLIVKHSYRQAENENWVIECWLSGARMPISYPLDVHIRVQSKKAQPMPECQVSLTLKNEKTNKSRQVNVEPKFRECSTLPKSDEVVYDNGFLATTPFPQLPGFWQATIDDPFKSDRRIPEAVLLDRGPSILNANVKLKDAGVFELNMPVLLYARGLDKVP